MSWLLKNGQKYISSILPNHALYHDSRPYAADFLSFWKFNSRHTSHIGKKKPYLTDFSHTHPWPLFFSRILPYQKGAQNKKWKPHFSVMSSHSELQPHRKPTSSIFQNWLIGILQTQSRALNETKPGLGFFPSYIHQNETLPQATTQHRNLVLKTPSAIPIFCQNTKLALATRQHPKAEFTPPFFFLSWQPQTIWPEQ